MNQTDQIRAEFEAKHPVPEYAEYIPEISLYALKRGINQSAITLGALERYNARWQGYQSGRAAVQGEAVCEIKARPGDFRFMHWLKPLSEIPVGTLLFTSPQPAQPDQWNAVTEAIDNIKLCFVDLVADKVALAAMVPLGRLVALENAILALRKGA